MLVKTRWVAVAAALALVATACGSRLSTEDLQAGGGTGSSTGSTSSGSGAEGAGITEGEGGPMVGTLPVPCGEGEEPPGPIEGVEGVSQDTIKIAVISDKAGQIKVPTASIEESMKAFVEFCNGFGGINGRTLELTTIDSKLFSHLEATDEACNAGVFALVGSGSVTDNQGAQAMVDCDLIEVPAYTATAEKGLSDRLVAPLPNPSDSYNIGPALWVASEHPDAVKKAALLAGGIDTATVQAERIKEAYEEAGFEFVYEKTTGVVQENYLAEAKAMQEAGVEYVNFVNSTPEAKKLLRDMNQQGFEPTVIDFGQQYYDPEMLEAGDAAEGLQVLLNTVPFEEADQSDALTAYLDAYDKVGSDIEPTSLGVQAFSAGLLFATAVQAVGDDLTRESVLDELHTITEWDGGGLHMVSNPGENLGNPCFMYSVVQDGAFERLHPTEPLTFDCNREEYVIPLGGDYGEGASAGGG